MKTPAAPYIAAFLLLPALAGLLAIPLAGCDSYNLSFKEFYEGEGESDPSAKAITGFRITSPVTAAGTVNETLKTIAVMVSSGTPVTNMVTAITHTGVSVYPPSGTAQDFTYPVPYTVTAADGSTQAYTVTVFPLVLLADITAYISGYTGPNPVPLAVDITLSASDWTVLLGAIDGALRSVALDLSACSVGTQISGGGLYSNGTFDPGTVNTGEPYIVSLVLPDAATGIKAGANALTPTFQDFTALESVTGKNIETVGDYAFTSCASLDTVSLPAATDIGLNAFSGCTGLDTVDLPAATDIGGFAFAGCTDLSSLSLPAAADIGPNAFSNCFSLDTVSLPEVTAIGGYAFSGCTALSSLSLPADPPSPGTYMFWSTYNGFDPTAVLTIHVPSAAAVSAYTSPAPLGWGVWAVTGANGNPTVYGASHKAITITN